MREYLKLPEGLRETLKKPWGRLCTDLSEIRGIEGDRMICVGDEISQRVLASGICPRLVVFDKKIKRKSSDVSQVILDWEVEEINLDNPAGGLTKESFECVKKSLSYKKAKIFVEGEEDLLVIPIIKFFPEGFIVLYGQPNEGFVVVRIDKKIKKKIDDLTNKFKKYIDS